MTTGASNPGGRGYTREPVRVSDGSRGGMGAGSLPYGDQLREQRRIAVLCFRCGDKYHIGHQCKRQILLLEGNDTQEEGEAEDGDCEGLEEEDNGEISIHALKGMVNNKIIKVEGQAKGGSLMILIDSGSTHNFLDEGTARRLNCKLAGTLPLSVTVANGQKVLSRSSCNGFCWEMQGEEFETDLRLLQLGSCDVVLGVDWMKGVSPISFDFNKMEVSFEKEGRRMTLSGDKEAGTCKMISGRGYKECSKEGGIS